MSMEVLPYVKLPNGETIRYRYRAGGTSLLVLIHGNMTSSKHWDVLMEQLDERFTIFAPDLRGFGQSSYNEKIMHIRDFASDVYQFVQALKLTNFDLIGWSTGGAVAMQFCATYPNIARKLVLLASASTRGYPFWGTNADGTPNFQERLTSYEAIVADPSKTQAVQYLYNTQNRDGLKAIWNAGIYTVNQPEPTKYEEYVDDMLTQRNLAEVYHALNTFNISEVDHVAATGTNEVTKITLPTLVLRGDRDYIVTQQMTEEILEDLGPDTTFEPLVNCGHSPLIDDCAQLVEKIEKFLL